MALWDISRAHFIGKGELVGFKPINDKLIANSTL